MFIYKYLSLFFINEKIKKFISKRKMSLRSGNNKKKGQKHQNTYTYHHNKGSLISRKILSSPLDLLCERCLEILSWKVKYNKYHPLKTPGKYNQCKENTMYKACGTLCDVVRQKMVKKVYEMRRS